jgi:hypothetical protein
MSYPLTDATFAVANRALTLTVGTLFIHSVSVITILVPLHNPVPAGSCGHLAIIGTIVSPLNVRIITSLSGLRANNAISTGAIRDTTGRRTIVFAYVVAIITNLTNVHNAVTTMGLETIQATRALGDV